MKFKVLKGTELFKQLDNLKKEMNRCNKLAFDFVESLGYKSMRGKFNTLAGGLSSIIIEAGHPKDWRKCEGKHEYFPMKRKSNKELLDKINSLPIIVDDDLNKILNFQPWGKRKNERHLNFHPAVQWSDAVILVDVSSNYVSYKPFADMIEILDSEYLKLQTKIDEKNK